MTCTTAEKPRNAVTVPNLCNADVVHMHGGRFLVLEDAADLGSVAAGKAVYGCWAVCLSGEVPGYFRPGSRWWFQGNAYAVHVIDARP